MAEVKAKLEHQEIEPLKWPDGFGRTLIGERRSQGAWKKPYSVYVKAVVDELQRFGASAVQITRNPSSEERFDPGVAVWFSLKQSDDFSWQKGLEIDKPKPTIAEIDDAFRRLSKKHHPDTGGDPQMFVKLTQWRKQAKAWVMGESAYSLTQCLPCDDYVEQRQNLASIKLILNHLRALERLGNKFIVERIMERSFRAALPANASSSEEQDGVNTAA